MTLKTDAYDAAHNVVAIVQAERNDPTAAAQYIASLTPHQLALCLHAAIIDLTTIWEMCAADAGITFDVFISRVVASIDEQAQA